MPKTTTTTVNQDKNGQYKVTIPKAVGDAFELDGEELEWRADGATALRAKIVDD